jgi:uroporphyrinogen decarboxylase
MPKKTLTSKERVILAANHHEADRVPITFDAEYGVFQKLYKHFGISKKEELWDALHVDTWFVGTDGKGGKPKDLGNGITEDIWGVRSKTVSYGEGSYTDAVYNPLHGDITIETMRKYSWPPLDLADFSRTRARCDAQKERALVGHVSLGPFFRASLLRGMDNLLTDMMAEPERAEFLLNKVHAYIMYLIKEQMRNAGDLLDIFYIADDYCMQSAPMMPPEIFERFFIPYIREIAEVVHNHDCKFLFHCCGSVRSLLPMMIKAGVDMLEPIQTRATGMEVEGLKRDFGKDLCFYGSVDLQEILSKGTPETVRQEVIKNMKTLGAGGGLIIGPGHTYIQTDTSLENILTMYETAYMQGKYPLN